MTPVRVICNPRTTSRRWGSELWLKLPRTAKRILFRRGSKFHFLPCHNRNNPYICHEILFHPERQRFPLPMIRSLLNFWRFFVRRDQAFQVIGNLYLDMRLQGIVEKQAYSAGRNSSQCFSWRSPKRVRSRRLNGDKG